MSINPADYYFDSFEVSDDARYKYKAILKKRSDQLTESYVFFGARNKDHYKDRSGLNAYVMNNKGKKTERTKHKQENGSNPDYNKKYSSLWFEKKVLY